MTARPTTRTPVMLSDAWTRKTHALPFHRSRPVTGVCALGASSASVRLSNCSPWPAVRAGTVSSASTVWRRSPPESCIRTIAPLPPLGVARRMISLDAGLAPVLAVGVVDDGDVAAACRCTRSPARTGCPWRRRRRSTAAGTARCGCRPRPRAPAGSGTAPSRRGFLRLVGEVGVVEGVQADLVALVDHAPDQVRVAGGHGAGDEEDGVRVVLLQHVEDLGGPGRVRAVVEGEDEPVVREAQARRCGRRGCR